MKRLALGLLLCGLAFSANHAVGPSPGSGNHSGSDWNNMMSGIPSSLTCGDVYYLADGAYGTYTMSASCSSGSPATLRKAQSYDYGGLANFNVATMGSAQATFSGNPGVTFSGNYNVLDGNGRQTQPGCGGAPGSTVTASPPTITDCGIKVTNTSASSFRGSGNNYTTRYVEVLGSGINDGNSLAEWFTSGSGSTIDHVYAHNAGCNYFQYGGNNRTVSFSYFWGTETNGGTTCHGQFDFYTSVSNLDEHANVLRDIKGTALWTLATFSGQTGVADNIKLYNNVAFYSSPAASWSPSLSDGILSCIANTTGTEQCSNIFLMQNSFINLNTGSIYNDCPVGCGAGGSYTLENNIFYRNGAPAFMNLGVGTFTFNHNSCLNSGSCPSGTGNVTDASPPNPFVNWQANFNLASENADWNNRASLGAPYTTDVNGTTFTTDRGAYQYGSVSAVATPTDSPGQGTYTSAQTVSLSDSTSGATICYTTDGSTPTATTAGTCDAGSTTYSSGLAVASTATVKAIGTKDGMTNSGVLTSVYTINLPSATSVSASGGVSFSGGARP